MSHPSDSRISLRRQRKNCARPSTIGSHPHRASLNKHAVSVKFLIQSLLAVPPGPPGITFSRPDGILAKDRHQNITGNHKAVPRTHRLKLTLEDAVGSLPRQKRLPAITTERHEMKTAALLVSDKFPHHETILRPFRWRASSYPTLR
jgi:hypothetical protein